MAIRNATKRNKAILAKRFGKIGEESIICPFCRQSFWQKESSDVITCSYCGSIARVQPNGDHWEFNPKS